MNNSRGNNPQQQSVEPEVFASLCAIELPENAPGLLAGTWTTGQGTGSDVDD